MTEEVRGVVVALIYLLSATLFIYGLKLLGKVRTASLGNQVAALAMMLAVLGTLLELRTISLPFIFGGIVVGALVGAVAAFRVQMTAMPEMVALFNGFGGAASALVALSVYYLKVHGPGAVGTVAEAAGVADAVTIGLSVFIGAVTFSGSIIAYMKLQGSLAKGAPILLPGRHVVNLLLALGTVGSAVWFGGLAEGADATQLAVLSLTGLSLVLGVLLVIPIGGADMPVVVSLLNSYSGVAASAAGFVIGNPLLIIAGAMVGAAGLILTQIMCVAMNRSLLNVLVGGFGQTAAGGGGGEYVGVKSAGPEEAALVLEDAESVVFVPGYGLAVAQAQHIVRELAELLEKRGTKVSYAIHPVAGRMPGHMNVLLAEADVPYEQLVEMDSINPEFPNTSVSIVIGANDVVNPVAAKDPSSPIYGMPILEVHKSTTVFVIKRSLGSGYAGIKNELFEYDNTLMLFGDAKKMLQGLVTEMKEAR
ncbi:MAG TPA: NAD(P)(+) transhydrogenase (Re/Si-specific) subunit beta [Polyangiaceae bacterium LLY-WYZ-14_1]|jgi:NAD(P) transhydrogenase subunit beta|nr:NAD(P)(+) transhydrogenase (Re/Si-specific) subunit beta [Polyangiaceae bacterium LLY-WYZ-14_1]